MAAQGIDSGRYPMGLPARCQALAQLQGQATLVKTDDGDLLGATGALGHLGKAAVAEQPDIGMHGALAAGALQQALQQGDGAGQRAAAAAANGPDPARVPGLGLGPCLDHIGAVAAKAQHAELVALAVGLVGNGLQVALGAGELLAAQHGGGGIEQHAVHQLRTGGLLAVAQVRARQLGLAFGGQTARPVDALAGRCQQAPGALRALCAPQLGLAGQAGARQAFFAVKGLRALTGSIPVWRGAAMPPQPSGWLRSALGLLLSACA